MKRFIFLAVLASFFFSSIPDAEARGWRRSPPRHYTRHVYRPVVRPHFHQHYRGCDHWVVRENVYYDYDTVPYWNFYFNSSGDTSLGFGW